MKEVSLERYAGPYKHIPFKYYVQSPIGLVPKANNQTRLIFHLSYDFNKNDKSINYHIPKELCTVCYRDLDHAIQQCIQLLDRDGREIDLVGGHGHKISIQINSTETRVLVSFNYHGKAPRNWRNLVFHGQMFAIWGKYKLCHFPEILQCFGTYCVLQDR